MAKYKIMAFTNAVSGQEEEFNRWYVNTHIPDVTRFPGVLSGLRYKVIGSQGKEPKYKYLAVYEVETDQDPNEFATKLLARAGTDEMFMSPTFDMEDFQMVTYQPID